MKIAALIVSRNRPDLVQAMVEQIRQRVRVPCDVFVVECGTDLDKLTPHTSAWYPDPDFRGKCYGHNIALQLALMKEPYDYYWVLMNDLVFSGEGDPAAALVETLERESRMAILSPSDVEGVYPESSPKAGSDWRAVTTCDYLGFMMRASALAECGFLNPDFKYCWGAIHELAYRLNRQGWFVAYSDRVGYRHLGGSTYGAKGTNTISRADYQRNAKRFAYDYFREQYGEDWDEVFTAAAAPFAPEGDTFRKHKRFWARAFTAEELATRESRTGNASSDAPRGASAAGPDVPCGIVFSGPSHANQFVASARPSEELPSNARLAQAAPAESAAQLLPPERAGLVKLHLGCGPEKRAGWINVDTQAEVQPDIVSSVESLPMVADASADVIEACHLFEHLTWNQARRALREWARVLKPGGELYLELPDLEACIRILGQHADKGGFDLGLIGIYGYPPAIEKQGVPQIHKWGWTKQSLGDELRDAGFTTVEFGPITQTWRPAAKVGRDMRLRAVRAGTVTGEPQSADAVGQRLHLFAWPEWSSKTEVEHLMRTFASAVAGTPEAGLVLRFDPSLDGSRETALALLADAHRRILGEERALDVHFVEAELDASEWEALALNITAVAALPSSATNPRSAVSLALDAPAVTDGNEWRALVARLRAAESDAQALVREPGLPARIEALNPWFYPLRVGAIDVVAGIGSPVSHEFLVNHTHCRARLLVDEVQRRYEIPGKSVLELASNCGYWSARYAELGAARVVGLEGREQFLQQAELYWSEGRFLPPEQVRFLRGNISDRRDWAPLKALGPFDFTLVAGILYHVPNYREVLRWASELTREALVIDTRVVHGRETLVEEPGELRFNAIAATRSKIVPNLGKLVAALEELGFAAEILPVDFPEAVGVENVDSFARRNRVAIFARRVHVPSGREPASVLVA